MQVPKKPQIDLLRGWPSPDLLPISLLSAACQHLLSDPVKYTAALQYGPDEGYLPLREGLSYWLGRHYGVKPDANRICITGGASQSLACILQSYTDPNYTRAIWLVVPCYHLVAGIFEDSGFAGRLRAVPDDDEGLNIAAFEDMITTWEERERLQPVLEPKPFKQPGSARKIYRHVIYCVPTCSNPSGKTMSLRRREALVQLARKHDALVISDDVYDFLQWPLGSGVAPEALLGTKLPRLCDIDLSLGTSKDDPKGFGYAISNGSFSKIAGPGVRTGWVEASTAFAFGLSQTASSKSGGAPSQFCAGMLAGMTQSGDLERHIEEITRPALQRRHALLLDAIYLHLSPLGVMVQDSSMPGCGTFGGYFVWLTLSHQMNSKLIAEIALQEENLVIGHGNMFTVQTSEEELCFESNIRLCFTWEPEEAIIEGVKRLSKLLKRIQNNRNSYEGLVAHKLE